jgi:hypothetical protein
LYLTVEEIDRVVQRYDKDAKAIKEELFKMCWFMRGGLTYNEALHLSVEERQIIAKIVESNLETTKETGHPFF